MGHYAITVSWQRDGQDFEYKTYDRTCTVKFGGGTHIKASNPKEYFGKPELPNPEELLISAVASCYMQTFLAYASLAGYVIETYTDEASGLSAKNEEGKMCVTEIALHPQIIFSSPTPPSTQALKELKAKALDNCFISHSVKSHVTVN